MPEDDFIEKYAAGRDLATVKAFREIYCAVLEDLVRYPVARARRAPNSAQRKSNARVRRGSVESAPLRPHLLQRAERVA